MEASTRAESAWAFDCDGEGVGLRVKLDAISDGEEDLRDKVGDSVQDADADSEGVGVSVGVSVTDEDEDNVGEHVRVGCCDKESVCDCEPDWVTESVNACVGDWESDDPKLGVCELVASDVRVCDGDEVEEGVTEVVCDCDLDCVSVAEADVVCVKDGAIDKGTVTCWLGVSTCVGVVVGDTGAAQEEEAEEVAVEDAACVDASEDACDEIGAERVSDALWLPSSDAV